jgi:hypothetical protein
MLSDSVAQDYHFKLIKLYAGTRPFRRKHDLISRRE